MEGDQVTASVLRRSSVLEAGVDRQQENRRGVGGGRFDET